MWNSNVDTYGLDQYCCFINSVQSYIYTVYYFEIESSNSRFVNKFKWNLKGAIAYQVKNERMEDKEGENSELTAHLKLSQTFSFLQFFKKYLKKCQNLHNFYLFTNKILFVTSIEKESWKDNKRNEKRRREQMGRQC